MKWLSAVFSILTATWTQSQPDPAEPPPEESPPEEDPTRDVGVEITFTPDSVYRGIRANMVHIALLSLGEIIWYHPDFVTASDTEMPRFRLTLRTSAPWETIYSAVAEKGYPHDFAAIVQVEPCYADPGPVPSPSPAGLDPTAPPPPAPLAAAEQPGGEAAAEHKSIRVDLERLETLSTLVGELAVEKAHLTDLAMRLEAVCVEGESRRLVQDLRRSVGKLSGVAGQLQEQATELRMVPVGTLFRRFTRLVRDLQDTTGKKLVLLREGEETMLDKSIVEEMADPLLHLIRNAADHGIERPDERIRAGKPESGTVILRAYGQSDQVVIEVEDDGRGIDVERVRAKAVERGLVSQEQADALSLHETLQLIFLPGFSTAAKVTDISGRGVGMDVVKANVERLRGTVTLETSPGRGSKVTVRLPLTVSILQVMLAEVADQTVAMPMSSLRGMVRLTEANRVLWGSVLRHQERLVPLVDLAAQWWQEQSDGATALLFAAGEQEAALVVNRPLGLGEVVVKPLDDYIGRLPGVSGSAILADGRVGLILDPGTLVTEISV